MAHHKSAKKRIRVSERKRVRNKAALTKMRTLIKTVLDSKDAEKAQVVLKEAVSYIDKTASKGRLHKNTAARNKSKLTRYVNQLAKAE